MIPGSSFFSPIKTNKWQKRYPLSGHGLQIMHGCSQSLQKARKDLEKALVNLKEVHSSRLINSRIIDDPDVIGNYTLGGTCKTKDDAGLIILFIENSIHQHEIVDDNYDWPYSND